MRLFTGQITNWDEWGNIYQSLPAFASLTEHIFQKENLPLAQIENLTPGTNAVFKVGEYVVKIFAPNESGIDQSLDLQTELFATARANVLGVSAPKLITHGFIEVDLIASYLKPGGIFIFNWDHPFMHCIEEKDGQLFFSGSYYESEPFTFRKGENRQQVRSSKKDGSYTALEGGYPLTLYNRRLSDYINTLAAAGFAVERVVEETDKATLEREAEFSSSYYTPYKAKKFPQSLIVKARKS